MADVSMSETEDCQRRFQAAVDVIHSLPRNGSYKPSYEVMLRFYGLYKQAVCGPCTVSRPGFWDPVGRYKWDAWNQMGDMSQEKAMAAYVDEMKKVAQEVIDTMAINEKTASYFYYFEPLYHVIHDMPRPPEALFTLKSDVKLEKPNEEFPVDELEKISEEPTAEQEILRASVSDGEVNLQSTVPPCVDGQGLTSDSENEVFSDSVEQLDTVMTQHSRIMDGNVHTGACAVQKHQYHPDSQVTHMGTGRGGEGANDGNRPPPVRRKNTRRDGTHQGWREPAGSASNRSAQQPASGSGSGSGSGGGDETSGGPEQVQDFQLHQQIILALHQLREDMQNVMERLEVVESLATANAQNSLWRSHLQFKAPEIETKWWPFDISGRTLLLLLLWPFVTQGLFFLLKRKRKQHMCI